MGRQIAGARFIVDSFIFVLNAIEFDDQLRIRGTKVGDVATDDHLAAEADAFEAAVAERTPDAFFIIGGVTAEGAGANSEQAAGGDCTVRSW